MAHSQASASCCVRLSRLGKERRDPIKGVQFPQRRERSGLGLLLCCPSRCQLPALTAATGRLKLYDPDHVAPVHAPFAERVPCASLLENGVADSLWASSWR